MTGLLVTIAGVVLLRSDGAALLQHRDDKPGLPHAGLWVPPGGHCESFECLEDCARREFLEETGYRCDTLHVLKTIEDDGRDHGLPQRLTLFWAEYDGFQQTVCLEGQALEFIRREDAHGYPIPGYLVDLWDEAWQARQRHAGPHDESKGRVA
jgi:8-oxo-dGTP pyrophosphatase MutT (NUDIX family)